MESRKLTNNQFKYLQSLKQKKYRQKYNKYIIEGSKLVRDLIHTKPELIDNVLCSSDFFEKYSESLRHSNLPMFVLNTKQLDQLSSFKSAPSCMAVVNILEQVSTFDLNKGRYIYLDRIQDPGNLGTIIRTADWFGITGLLLSPGCVDVYNPKVVHSSMGSFFRVPLGSLTEDDLYLTSSTIIATDMKGDSLKNFTFPENYILCFGNEGQGLSPKIKERADHRISIPSSVQGTAAESLNIAISCAICMFASQQ